MICFSAEAGSSLASSSMGGIPIPPPIRNTFYLPLPLWGSRCLKFPESPHCLLLYKKKIPRCPVRQSGTQCAGHPFVAYLTDADRTGQQGAPVLGVYADELTGFCLFSQICSDPHVKILGAISFWESTVAVIFFFMLLSFSLLFITL